MFLNWLRIPELKREACFLFRKPLSFRAARDVAGPVLAFNVFIDRLDVVLEEVLAEVINLSKWCYMTCFFKVCNDFLATQLDLIVFKCFICCCLIFINLNLNFDT